MFRVYNPTRRRVLSPFRKKSSFAFLLTLKHSRAAQNRERKERSSFQKKKKKKKRSKMGRDKNTRRNDGKKEAWMDDDIELANKTVQQKSSKSFVRLDKESSDEDEDESESEDEDEALMDVSSSESSDEESSDDEEEEEEEEEEFLEDSEDCLLYTSPSPRDRSLSRMPSSA